MKSKLMVGKKEFIHHTSKYLKLAEKVGELVITHHNEPCLYLVPIKKKSIRELRGLIKNIKIYGDINEPVFKEFDKW